MIQYIPVDGQLIIRLFQLENVTSKHIVEHLYIDYNKSNI